jgi:hypothetical protein
MMKKVFFPLVMVAFLGNSAYVRAQSASEHPALSDSVCLKKGAVSIPAFTLDTLKYQRFAKDAQSLKRLSWVGMPKIKPTGPGMVLNAYETDSSISIPNAYRGDDRVEIPNVTADTDR